MCKHTKQSPSMGRTPQWMTCWSWTRSCANVFITSRETRIRRKLFSRFQLRRFRFLQMLFNYAGRVETKQNNNVILNIHIHFEPITNGTNKAKQKQKSVAHETDTRGGVCLLVRSSRSPQIERREACYFDNLNKVYISSIQYEFSAAAWSRRARWTFNLRRKKRSAVNKIESRGLSNLNIAANRSDRNHLVRTLKSVNLFSMRTIFDEISIDLIEKRALPKFVWTAYTRLLQLNSAE